jgi:hypothetical protein
MRSISLSIVGRAVIAVVTSSAENNGTAINKVADLLVRPFVGQRRNIAAGIPLTEARP